MKAKLALVFLLSVFWFVLPAQTDSNSVRRKNAVSVKVKAPSRGLVSRWPGDVADLMRGDEQRIATLAKNMRFEDGAMKNAPGYERVHIASTILTNMIAHWKMNEASGVRYDSFSNHDLSHPINEFFGAPGKLGNAIVMGPHTGGGDNGAICTMANVSYPAASSLTLCGWIKFGSVSGFNVLFFDNASDLVSPFMLFRSGTAFSVAVCDGVGAHQTQLDSSVAVSAGTWYFFAARYDDANKRLSIRLNATEDHGANGSYTYGLDPAVEYAHIFSVGEISDNTLLDSISFWSRYLSDAELDFIYNSGNGRDFPFAGGVHGKPNLIHEGNLISDPNRPLIVGTDTDLFSVARGYTTDPRAFDATLSQLFSGTANTDGYFWSGCDFYDKILFAQHDNEPQYWVNGASATLPLPGLNVNADQFSAVSDGSEKFDGVTSFFNHALLWRGDLLKWSDLDDFTNYIPVADTATTATLTVAGGGFTQPAVGSTVVVTTTEDPSGSGTVITVGQYVRIDDTQSGSPTYNFYLVTAKSTGPNTVTLKLLGTTGRTDSGATVAAGKSVQTLDANEAGEARTIGAQANGPIFQVVPMADYAFVFKEWSIQSLQYVGAGNGIFYLRTEVTREGPVGRNAVRNLGNGSIVFLGHRELYSYSGGPQPQPVCRQYTRQLFAELDRTRLHEILIHHREPRNEVWVVYPVTGGQKVLVWNYVEDTATLDEYDQSFAGIAALAPVNWTVDPSWSGEPDSLLWEGVDQLLSWNDFADSGNIESSLIATGSGDLLIHGFVYNRDGEGYTALAETMDYDFGDNTVFKYVDVVHVGLQVRVPDNAPRNLYIQVGTRSTLDEDITWSAAKSIDVRGNANFTAKVNPGGAGRYVRLRFYSEDADVRWEVSSYEIYARAGGTC